MPEDERWPRSTSVRVGRLTGDNRAMAGQPGSGPAGVLRGLLLACHPGPTVAVTALTTALAAGVGNRAGDVMLVGAAVLAGQLSIGWSNDWIDAARDRAVGRSDKPAATGAVSAALVGVAGFLAAVVAVPLSLALGWRAALAAFVVIIGGWAYNAGMKATALSWLPYAVAFGSVPAIASLTLPAHPLPPLWAAAAGALLGIGAHLANVLPDLEQDRATGVRGWPHRLGRTRTAVLAPVLLLLATLSVVFGPAAGPGVASWIGLGVAIVLAGSAALVALRRARSRLPFLLTIGVAVVDVVLLIAAGSRLQ
jgi:4-hydroxybenzoate polyprenyltransferase